MLSLKYIFKLWTQNIQPTGKIICYFLSGAPLFIHPRIMLLVWSMSMEQVSPWNATFCEGSSRRNIYMKESSWVSWQPRYFRATLLLKATIKTHVNLMQAFPFWSSKHLPEGFLLGRDRGFPKIKSVTACAENAIFSSSQTCKLYLFGFIFLKLIIGRVLGSLTWILILSMHWT